MSTSADRVAELLAATSRLQSEAADPLASVWVSANAGTGKTHVLTQRVLRLLLAGTPPERILCLTYTKAAAAEMSKRVFDTLSGWIGLSDAALDATLARLLGTSPATSERTLARTLFARAIETPGGLKVQTIHAFCERLLQRFPLEAGVAPGFEILDDATCKALIREAIDGTLLAATADRASPLGQALTAAVRYAVDDTFDAMLSDAIRRRALLASLIRRADLSDTIDPLESAGSALRAALAVRPYVTAAELADELAHCLPTPVLLELAALLAAGKKSDQDMAPLLRAAAGASGAERIDALASYFLTKDREPRAKLVTNGLRDENPALVELAVRAQGRFAALDRERSGLDVVNATLALYCLADTVLTRYQAAKSARAALDFDDLIVKTGSLLSLEDGAAWVLYKLDGGLDHVLVDEAQDTAPEQWQVIEAIAREFFADRGAGARTAFRTVFAVGDEKQSIYSFQGAAPEMFAATGARFSEQAQAVGQPWRTTALTLSFRTVEPILAAVDAVFADPAVTPGLIPPAGDAVRHAVKRLGQGGLVEIWPPEQADGKPQTDAWAPLEEAERSSPVQRLADRIARTIKSWLDTGERLQSQNRAIRAGDILILLRKREPLAPAIVAALKALRVPVAGADRIRLVNQIAVQDLLALGDVLTLPEDDLALAAVLKSPLFGLDDDDLLTLAHRRPGTLWKALLDAGQSPRFAPACERLKRWRKEADFLPPFEFYASVLDHDGSRLKMLERLGPEAADGIDEFLNLALTFDDRAPPSLTGFLAHVRAEDREIKRDMDQGRDEVRVLTVHGSKGLEAPILFLPDTCAIGSARANGLIELPGTRLSSSTPDLAVWPVKGSSALPAIAAAKAHIKAGEFEERNRLLYVALTRPRDRLYVCGFQTKDTRPPECWYELITRGLAPLLTNAEGADGLAVRRIALAQSAAHEPPALAHATQISAAPKPAWVSARAPREPAPAIPIAPSRLAPYDFDAAGEPMAHPPATSARALGEAPVPSPRPHAADHRFARGTLTHALLEYLPHLPEQAWHQAALGFLEARGPGLTSAMRQSIATETLAVLHDPVFAALFGPDSLAEVPLVAELAHPDGKGPPLRVHGQIDRLVDLNSQMLIVDYKTNRPPPMDVASVPETYLLQLAAYRAALAVIAPGVTIRAALLWTEVPRLMEIPAATLDHHAARLWQRCATGHPA